jgi:hypothetical protein
VGLYLHLVGVKSFGVAYGGKTVDIIPDGYDVEDLLGGVNLGIGRLKELV